MQPKLQCSCPPTLLSCADAQMPTWGDMLPLPGGRNPGSISRFMVPMQARLPVAELGSRPPAIKYSFTAFRFCKKKITWGHLYEGQRSFLTKIRNTYCRGRWSVKSGWAQAAWEANIELRSCVLCQPQKSEDYVRFYKKKIYIYRATKRQVQVWAA